MIGGRQAAYSAGNKIYGGGRPHPTSGPVDPTGYVNRAANKSASNRRSGLAAAASRRLQGANPMAGSGSTSAIKGQGQQLGVGTTPKMQPNVAAPIVLPDGRKVVASATGQYKFLQNEVRP